MRSVRSCITRVLHDGILSKSKGKLHEAVEGLLNLEKMARVAEDITATKACCSAVLAVCFNAKDFKLLEEQIMLLSKRRSQLKQAIQAFVRQAITYIDQAPDQDTKVALIKTLQAVTEGKVGLGGHFDCRLDSTRVLNPLISGLPPRSLLRSSARG